MDNLVDDLVFDLCDSHWLVIMKKATMTITNESENKTIITQCTQNIL